MKDRSRLRLWIGRLAPWAIAVVTLVVLLRKYDPSQVLAEMRKGHAAAMFPFPFVLPFTIGSGAGFFAADVKDPAAIAAFTGDATKIYATRRATSGGGKTLSFFYGSSVNVPAGQLPTYMEGYSSSAWAAEIADAGDGKMSVSIRALDRASQKVEVPSWTFDGCKTVAAQPSQP